VRGLPRQHQGRRWSVPHWRLRISSWLLRILVDPAAVGSRSWRHEV